MTTEPNSEKVRTTQEEPKVGIMKNLFTIFRPYEKEEEKHKRHKFIHYAFKPWLVMPLLTFAEKFLNKYLIKSREDIPDKVYNKNFLVLYDSVHDTFKEWWFTFKGIDVRMELKAKGLLDPKGEEDLANWLQGWEERKKHHWYRIPDILIRMVITMCLEDTAYREQMNMILFRLQANMNKNWNPEVKHVFPLYQNRYDMDINYFVNWELAQNPELQLIIKKDKVNNRLEFAKVPVWIQQLIEEVGKVRAEGKSRITLEFADVQEDLKGKETTGENNDKKEQSKVCETDSKGTPRRDKPKKKRVHPDAGKVSGSNTPKDRKKVSP